MTMTKFFRTAVILMLAVLMVVTVAACGKDEPAASGASSNASSGASSDAASDVSSNVAVQGKTETWGNITVAVPEGMTFKGGNALDEEDPNVVTLQKEDNAFNYYLITVVADEEQAKNDIGMSKEVNEGSQDVSVSAGAQWTGVTYEYSGTPVFHIYGMVDGKAVEVQSYGFAADADSTKAVLGSLKIAAAE